MGLRQGLTRAPFRWLLACAAVAACAAVVACDGAPEERAPGAPVDAPPPPPPPDKCAFGEWTEDDGACLPPGVPATSCAPGFVANDGGCRAVLPAAPCGPGEMALPGETACRPVLACGASTYAELPAEAGTQHVLAAYEGADSDGSEAHPWTTIGDAIGEAEDGALVLVGPGTYEEDVYIGKPVRVVGTCPGLVEIAGASEAVFLGPGADGAVVRGVAIRSDSIGVAASGPVGARVEASWIHDTDLHGVHANDAFGRPEIEIVGSLVERASQYGVSVFSGRVAVVDSVVRDTGPLAGADDGAGVAMFAKVEGDRVEVLGSVIERNRNAGVFAGGGELIVDATYIGETEPAEDGTTGQGLFAATNTASGVLAVVHVRRSELARNHNIGLHVIPATLTIEDTTIRETLPREVGAILGRGLSIEDDFEGVPSTATIVRSLVADNHDAGILVEGADVIIERTIVRGTRPQESDLEGSGGIVVQLDFETGRGASAQIRGTWIHDNHPSGLLTGGASVLVDNCAIERSAAQASDGDFGRGIEVRYEPVTLARGSLDLRSTLVADNHDVGVLVVGSDAWLDGVVVSGTSPRDIDGKYGDGLSVILPPEGLATSATVTASSLEGNARAAISNFGSSVTVGATTFECNPIDLHGEAREGVAFVFEDGGGNACACDDAVEGCLVQSAALDVPEL